MAKQTLKITIPNGSIATRRTERTYSHAVAVEWADGWKVEHWCGRLDLALKQAARYSGCNVHLIPVDGSAPIILKATSAPVDPQMEAIKKAMQGHFSPAAAIAYFCHKDLTVEIITSYSANSLKGTLRSKMENSAGAIVVMRELTRRRNSRTPIAVKHINRGQGWSRL